jgi:tRNA(Arg) A34 adenosine deaminase TadA
MMTRRRPISIDLSRRGWLTAACLGFVPVAAQMRAARAAPAEPIVQPPRAEPKAFMERAFDMKRQAEAAGDQGFGAVVVEQDRIVGQAPSAVVVRTDPTAHAEMEAIRDAARRLGRRSLAGCSLYSSFRPCPMCEAAAAWAGIDRMIFGATLADAGSPRLGRC